MKRIPRVWAAVLAAALLCCGCAAQEKPVPEQEEPIQQTMAPAPEPGPAPESLPEPEPDPVAERMEGMSLEEMVWQMLFVRPESISKSGTVTAVDEAVRRGLEQYPVGGIVYFAANLVDREQTIRMICDTQTCSGIPLFIGVDEEGGRVARVGRNPAMGTTMLPPMKQIGDSRDPMKALEVGKTLAEDLLPLGFNVDFAPDADVIVRADNSEIGDRSFGSDADNVSTMVEHVVLGMQDGGLSAALKHFPGHGSTYVNSHNGYSESGRTKAELEETELAPFRAGIAAGADFVMVSHMTLVEATQEKVPCSVSEEVITDWLLGELGYEGIVITDSFEMGAVTQMYTQEEAAVKAVKAGVDMILMPPEPEVTCAAVLDAVRTGEISQERIEHSVYKILSLKLEKGMLA